MKWTTLTLTLAATLTGAAHSVAAPTATTSHSSSSTGLAGMLVPSDLLSGLIATELPGDKGWHPANPASGNSLDPLGLPAFTDDVNNTGLAGLLNDFPGVGTATKVIRYDLAAPADVRKIQILSGNDGADGRVFSTTHIRYSTDGSTYQSLGYFESDPLGTVNAGTWRATLVDITDNGSPLLAAGVTNLVFEFYAVDNTGGQYRDPFDGVNGFTGVDDGLSAAFVAPLIWEINAVAIPEPATYGMFALGAALVGRTLRRRR